MSTDRVDTHRPLSGRAARVARERPDAWQVRLFAVVLLDELAAADVVRDTAHPAQPVAISDDALVAWVRGRLTALHRLSVNASALVNQVLPVVATSEVGGRDAIAVASVARQLALVHADAVGWATDVRRHTSPRAALTEAIATLATVSQPLTNGVRTWAAGLESAIEHHLAHPPGAPAAPGTGLALHLDPDHVAMQKLQAQLSALDPTFRLPSVDPPPLR